MSGQSLWRRVLVYFWPITREPAPKPLTWRHGKFVTVPTPNRRWLRRVCLVMRETSKKLLRYLPFRLARGCATGRLLKPGSDLPCGAPNNPFTSSDVVQPVSLFNFVNCQDVWMIQGRRGTVLLAGNDATDLCRW